MLDRRTFLRRLGFGTVAAAAAALTFDVEKLLWVPGERTILLPAADSFSGNTLITPDWIIRDVARIWKNNIKLAAFFDAEYNKAYPRIQWDA